METEKVIEFLREELDPSYFYLQRGMFIEINTFTLSATGFPITVFVTNNLPDFIVVSDNAWIYENKYGNWLAMSNNDRKNLEAKWGITARTDETDQFYHSVICRKQSEVKHAMEALIGFIQELNYPIKNVKP